MATIAEGEAVGPTPTAASIAAELRRRAKPAGNSAAGGDGGASPDSSSNTSGATATGPLSSASQSGAGDAPSKAQRGTGRSGLRINRVLGRIVPLVILVYISYTYDLVVLRYHYAYVYKVLGRPLVCLAHLSPAHVGFFATVRAYLQVFFGYSSPASAGQDQSAGSRAGPLARYFGKTFEPHKVDALSTDRVEIQACQADGQPLRCWRDSCNGRLRGARTRHCGDCGTCRVGFDHHCAWFDNDVTAPSTLRPFMHFLLLVPPLLSLALAPLFSVGWQHARQIWRLSCQDGEIASSWWSRWYSWAGGPVFRYAVAWLWAGRKASAAAGATSASRRGDAVLAVPSLRVPMVIALGAVFASIAIVLAISTIQQLRKGELTVDVQRRKTYRRLLSESPRNPRADAMEPRSYFRVPHALLPALPSSEQDEGGSEVVSMTLDEGVWSRPRPSGGREVSNLFWFLLDASAPGKMAEGHWPLSPSVEKELLRRADEQRRRRSLPSDETVAAAP